MSVGPIDIADRERHSATPSFMLRCRMRHGLKNRIDKIVEWDQQTENNWTRSDAVREALLEYAERREAEIARAKAREIDEPGVFLGAPPLREEAL